MAFNLAGSTRPQLYRISHIDNRIKAGRYPNSRRLAEDLGVSRRTILRDVEFIKDSLSAPLGYCPRKRGYYYIEADYTLGLLKLTEGELLALYLGHRLLTRCKGTPFEQSVINAFNKICCHLQETVDIDFGQVSDFIAFDLEPLRGEEEQVAGRFAAIGAAIRAQKRIRLTHYAIADDVCRVREVDPYQLRYYQGAWYLVGFCRLRRAPRIFALDRIRELQLTNTAFALPRHFDPDRFFNDTFQLYKGPAIHRVRIWFSPEQARWIREKLWHPTQQIEENLDGSLVLSMHTSGLPQVKRWVLSYGSHAKALAPPELISNIVQELTAARPLYQDY